MAICAEILVEIDKCGFKYKNKLLQMLMSCSFAQKWSVFNAEKYVYMERCKNFLFLGKYRWNETWLRHIKWNVNSVCVHWFQLLVLKILTQVCLSFCICFLSCFVFYGLGGLVVVVLFGLGWVFWGFWFGLGFVGWLVVFVYLFWGFFLLVFF